MELNDKLFIQERYKNRLEKYGPGIQALASGTEERRKIRFDVLRDIGIYGGCSVLDVGCGFADFYQYLHLQGIPVSYTGIDIVPELIHQAKVSHPHLELAVRDLQEEPFSEKSFDFVVCSQVFNLELGKEKNDRLVQNFMKEMFGVARQGVAIDFLTSYVDFQQVELHYYQPETILSYAKGLTRRIVLRHDYPLFEFCLYLYPTFHGWSST